MPSELDWVQQWYRAQCNGVWEHSFGVKIDTLDNPGWAVTIDLNATPLEHVSMDTVFRDDGPGDWIRLEVKGAQFLGRGDPSKLGAILDAFQRWARRTQAAHSGTDHDP
jgi:hypothetical protein